MDSTSMNRDVDLKKDLEATVRELSDTYEELSLLYKLSDTLTGLSVDEIAAQVVEEAIDTIDAKTAALLLYDEDKGLLSTQSAKGGIADDRHIFEGNAMVREALSNKRPVTFRMIPQGKETGSTSDWSVLACPLIGKNKVIGVLVLADRRDKGEFFANDIKLVMAIAAHTALTIENALLYRELEGFLVLAIRSLVKALEASSQWTAGHTERVTEYALGIGEAMGFAGKKLEALQMCSLLHDIGKIAIPRDILDKPDTLSAEELREVKKHPLIGAEIMGGFKQLQEVILGIKYHHEWWDGENSLLGLRGEEIPLMARILAVADSFDAMTSDRPYRKKKARDTAIQEITGLAGKQYDPSVVAAFNQWVSQQYSVFSP